MILLLGIYHAKGYREYDLRVVKNRLFYTEYLYFTEYIHLKITSILGHFEQMKKFHFPNGPLF